MTVIKINWQFILWLAKKGKFTIISQNNGKIGNDNAVNMREILIGATGMHYQEMRLAIWRDLQSEIVY